MPGYGMEQWKLVCKFSLPAQGLVTPPQLYSSYRGQTQLVPEHLTVKLLSCECSLWVSEVIALKEQYCCCGWKWGMTVLLGPCAILRGQHPFCCMECSTDFCFGQFFSSVACSGLALSAASGGCTACCAQRWAAGAGEEDMWSVVTSFLPCKSRA